MTAVPALTGARDGPDAICGRAECGPRRLITDPPGV